MELDQMTRPELHALIRRYASELTVAHTTAQEQADLAVRQVAIIYGLEQKMATMQHKPQPTPGVGPCAGLNCGATDGVSHSVECAAEHAAVIAGGRFVSKGAPAVTVDTPEFCTLLSNLDVAGEIPDNEDGYNVARAAFIAHIDAHTQAAVKAEAARCSAIMVEKLRHGPVEVAAKQDEIDRLRFELREATDSLVARMAAPQQHAQAPQQEGSRPAAYSEMSLGELLERYWNIAFSEGQDGVSRGSEAQEVLSALMAFDKDAQAALSRGDHG